MIIIKNKSALQKMATAGQKLSSIFPGLAQVVVAGATTADVDAWIEKKILELGMVSRTKGYRGYRHASCISVNDEVVHGVPRKSAVLSDGDLVKVDVCASWQKYCADMARCFVVGQTADESVKQLVLVAQQALDKGIAQARVGNRVSDISVAIQQEVERHGYGVVRDFAGHGIGKSMHEEPEVLNYGELGEGPVLQAGMVIAIEPMITKGGYEVFVEQDGWTVKTDDGSLAAHVEDTVAITYEGPKILTRS